MKVGIILTIILITRILRLYFIAAVHNLLVKYRILYPILMLISIFFWRNPLMAMTLLSLSFIIYAGPVLTGKIIDRLEKKLAKREKILKIYIYESRKLLFADSPEKAKTAIKHIKRLHLLDGDLKKAIKISRIIKIIWFILLTIILATAGILILIWLV